MTMRYRIEFIEPELNLLLLCGRDSWHLAGGIDCHEHELVGMNLPYPCELNSLPTLLDVGK